MRRRLTAILALVVVVWIAVCIIAGVLGISHILGPLPFETWPRPPI